MATDDAVECCPECESTNISYLVDGIGQTGSDDPDKVYCSDCGEKFPEPEEREPRNVGNITLGPAAEILNNDIDIMEDA